MVKTQIILIVLFNILNPLFYAAVHCKVTPWNQWSACSVSCGEGKRIKQRKVLRAPSEDGKSCPELILSKSCKMPACLEENYELIEEGKIL